MLILKAQTKWRWIIAGYLFLAGLGAGAYLTGVACDFIGTASTVEMRAELDSIAKVGISLGFPCVFVGCLLLIFDLGKPINFWRAFMRPNCSWMARGSLIIAIFMGLGAIHIAFWIWPFAPEGFRQATNARHFIGALGAIFAVGTMIYTGVLLAAARPIAFWSTAMLPLLFLVSALSTGVMAVVLVGSLTGIEHAGPMAMLAKVDIALIVFEVLVIIMYFQATHRVPESRASAKRVLSGPLAPLFWFGFAVLGLLIPLVLELLGAFSLHGSGAATVTSIAAVCGIIGGLMLRQVILAGGIHAPLKAGRFEYGLPIV